MEQTKVDFILCNSASRLSFKYQVRSKRGTGNSHSNVALLLRTSSSFPSILLLHIIKKIIDLVGKKPRNLYHIF
jgi:hypothetical protein